MQGKGALCLLEMRSPTVHGTNEPQSGVFHGRWKANRDNRGHTKRDPDAVEVARSARTGTGICARLNRRFFRSANRRKLSLVTVGGVYGSMLVGLDS